MYTACTWYCCNTCLFIYCFVIYTAGCTGVRGGGRKNIGSCLRTNNKTAEIESYRSSGLITQQGDIGTHTDRRQTETEPPQYHSRKGSDKARTSRLGALFMHNVPPLLYSVPAKTRRVSFCFSVCCSSSQRTAHSHTHHVLTPHVSVEQVSF